MNFFRRFFPKAKIVKYPEPMAIDKIRQVFLDQGEESLIWQALDSIIDRKLLDSVNMSADPGRSPNELFHSGGRIDALSELKFEIEELKSWKNGKIPSRQN